MLGMFRSMHASKPRLHHSVRLLQEVNRGLLSRIRAGVKLPDKFYVQLACTVPFIMFLPQLG